MVISRKAFLKGNFRRINNNKNEEHPIAVFLSKNRKSAFTIKELVKKTGMKNETIRSILRKLKKKKSIEHKSPYVMWRL